MFIYHEQSQTALFRADLSVHYAETRLNALERTLGYLPMAGDHSPLEVAIGKRLPNRYFLKYGDIADLCLGWQGTLQNGEQWIVKPYPRAATGADLRQFLIGADSLFPVTLETCTVKTFPLPAEERIVLTAFSSVSDAEAFLYWMLDQFIRPLAAWLGPWGDLSLKTPLERPLETPVLALSLSGEGKWIDAEIALLEKQLLLSKGTRLSLASTSDRHTLRKILHGTHPLSAQSLSHLVPRLGGPHTTKKAGLDALWRGAQEKSPGIFGSAGAKF